ncbi:MAG: aspartyl/glutamyl-tRNA amidotransferase subunit A [Deltaproteobacteria bacterium GWA2_38_16]|nr:MAG: aspartyl/glutamyl-tRNA amidotransferase subunit A [Deltaproteobacteria bacterium GWA2_38_16]OGQ01821.1 MAG: aspartyl/glutamyl-tRNA amidotransferase subunit A [Deltaproteobacteria bacterium RIFCSPHIGHO2_02_FULL_38_15]OGQ58912.1 MAG: aspartyl/glutamyl-tRNA amidotransferase subunit A [Deltaproteobacteria bacterium RIFCSPLOWO2_12_FULL_38_8]HBQ21383.1 Asp-tRNA(Asn)/Glu-tRNA(Gln) amidotransferase GatCAB subunit A [Deltaproteobacteria bacterium]
MPLYDYSLDELSQKLQKKEVSSVELTQSVLKRIEETKAKLNTFITLTKESALQTAKTVDQKRIKGEVLSPLAGIPIALKDIFLTQGIKTTCCSKILSQFIPPYDSTVVKRLKQNDVVLVGKLNMDEFAMGSSNENSCFGPVKNPWDLERTPGGSSGGSAAAVAASQCLGAFGTDTGGSIRQPASLCGVVGIKPTYGRVSRYGIIAFASSLDQVGPFGKRVKDVAHLLKAVAGRDSMDSTSADMKVPDYTQFLTKDIKGLKIGIAKEYFIKGMEASTEKVVHKAIDHLKKLGAKIIDVSLPHTSYAVPTYYLIATAEASSNLARYDGVKYGYRAKASTLQEMYRKTRGEGFGREVKRRIMLGTFVLSSGYYDAYYKKASQVRTLIKRDFDEAFKHCDLIVTPTSPTTAFKLGEKMEDPLQMYLSDIFTISANLAGLPGLVLPCGFDEKNLPIGLQILGPHFKEEKIFHLAYAYEQSTEWHQRKPTV